MGQQCESERIPTVHRYNDTQYHIMLLNHNVASTTPTSLLTYSTTLYSIYIAIYIAYNCRGKLSKHVMPNTFFTTLDSLRAGASTRYKVRNVLYIYIRPEFLRVVYHGFPLWAIKIGESA